MNREQIKNPVTLDSIALQIEGLGTRLDKRMDSLDSRMDKFDSRMDNLESQIDSLAIAVNNEFVKIHFKLDELDKNLIEFKEDFRMKTEGLQNQLDNIYLNYVMRNEYVYLEKRVKVLERKVH